MQLSTDRKIYLMKLAQQGVKITIPLKSIPPKSDGRHSKNNKAPRTV